MMEIKFGGKTNSVTVSCWSSRRSRIPRQVVLDTQGIVISESKRLVEATSYRMKLILPVLAASILVSAVLSRPKGELFYLREAVKINPKVKSLSCFTEG